MFSRTSIVIIELVTSFAHGMGNELALLLSCNLFFIGKRVNKVLLWLWLAHHDYWSKFYVGKMKKNGIAKK